jgi:hypothetical protein
MSASSLGHALSALPGQRGGVAALYDEAVVVGAADVPAATSATHTMRGALDTYVAQRLPTRLIDDVLAGGARVEVRGVFPDHVAEVLPGAVLVDPGPAFPSSKVFNCLRPKYYWWPWAANGAGHDTLVVAVPPGRDYVSHYASLVAHRAKTLGHPVERVGPVIRYPAAEAAIARWTELAAFVAPGDRVLMGYVQEITPYLVAAGATIVATLDNAYYGAVRLAFPGTTTQVCALGVRFSFWGCIAARLAAACQSVGAIEVVYAGKLGCLSSPDDIYERIFAPSAYLDFGEGRLIVPAELAPPNGLLAAYPSLDTGLHMSVGTVLEEDAAQREYADRVGVTTIDNEIAQMARALATGAGPAGGTAFAAIHFATDYLHTYADSERADVFNLTNHRSPQALRRKAEMLGRIGTILGDYFDSDLPVPLTGRHQRSSLRVCE